MVYNITTSTLHTHIYSRMTVLLKYTQRNSMYGILTRNSTYMRPTVSCSQKGK